MLLLDTKPLVDFFKDQSESVKKIISDSEEADIELAISVITISELFYILSRFGGTDFAAACIDNLKSQLKMEPVTAEIAQKAGEFKFRYAGKERKGLPMADAIIAATAFVHGAELVTNDPHFEKIKEIKARKV